MVKSKPLLFSLNVQAHIFLYNHLDFFFHFRMNKNYGGILDPESDEIRIRIWSKYPDQDQNLISGSGSAIMATTGLYIFQTLSIPSSWKLAKYINLIFMLVYPSPTIKNVYQNYVHATILSLHGNSEMGTQVWDENR